MERTRSGVPVVLFIFGSGEHDKLVVLTKYCKEDGGGPVATTKSRRGFAAVSSGLATAGLYALAGSPLSTAHMELEVCTSSLNS